MKTAYHHGELREALIGAARRLVGERGADGFSLADACRLAGVSTAAPYRHFADKQAIVDEVVAQGFIDMTARSRAAVAAFPPGAPERIQAVGQVYFTFAVEEPALFRLMFGQKHNVKVDDIVTVTGTTCFGFVLQEVIDFCALNAIEGDARLFAVQLWTMVHGAASLTIDGDYAKVAPDVSVAQVMAVGVDRLLFSRRPAENRPSGAGGSEGC